jgi:hypothetical protein
MSTIMMIHSAHSATLNSIIYDNARCLTIKIETVESGSFEITVFNLPDEFIGRAIAAFGEPSRWSYLDGPSVYPQQMADLTAENARLRQRVALLESRVQSAVA